MCIWKIQFWDITISSKKCRIFKILSNDYHIRWSTSWYERHEKNVNIHKADHFTWGYAIFIPSYTTPHGQRKKPFNQITIGIRNWQNGKVHLMMHGQSIFNQQNEHKKCNNERVKWQQNWVEKSKSCLFIQKSVKCIL